MTEPLYQADAARYDAIPYRRAGRSGVLLPAFSLGMWHNFGSESPLSNIRRMAHYAFDHGIVHFDLANNYGPAYGTAEENFGRLMDRSFRPYRDEMFIATKAGYDMWPGPYGNWGSRKHLTSSLDQSLRRMKLDYVDVFYTHRYDPATPLEETLQALVDIVRRGKALYVGISRYPIEAARFAFRYLAERDVPCLLFQDRYNLFNREPDTLGVLPLAVEAYFYFEVPEEHAVCHLMGEVDETRHIWMKNDQAVLSPEWSIHSAAATHNYTFIWGMGGENLDYGDQDFSKITDLK